MKDRGSRKVHPLAQLHLDHFQLGDHSLLLCLPSDLESSLSCLRAEVRESKEDAGADAPPGSRSSRIS